MRWLIVMLVGVITTLAIMSMQLSLAPGLSAKNALLYLLLFGLVFRTALRGVPAMELPGLHAVFGIWVAYAIGSWIVAAMVIEYPHYDLISNGIALKADLLDSFLFFLVAFHVLHDERDVRTAFRALAAAIGIANLATLADLVGLVHLGIRVGTDGAEEGRVFGVFGHANDTAALIVCLLPVSVAVVLESRGLRRVIWTIGALASLAVLILTVSRGAYVGAVVGSAGAAWLCRRFVPLHKLALWAFGGGLAVVVGVLIAGLAIPGAAELIESRLLGSGVGADQVSSGRTGLWQATLERMLDQPITFITGYGWDVYWVMPFRFATHNYYLHLWFNLGLVGLSAFIALIAMGISRALWAATAVNARLVPYHVAFLFGMAMLAVSVFFGNLGGQWALVWIYFGVAMRAIQIDLAEPDLQQAASEQSVVRARVPLRTGLAAAGASAWAGETYAEGKDLHGRPRRDGGPVGGTRSRR